MTYDNYTVRLLRSAQEDLADLISLAMTDSPSTANKLLALFLEELNALSEKPFVSASPEEAGLAQAGYRYVIVQNYMVFYVVEADTLAVHRIVPGANEYKGLFTRV